MRESEELREIGVYSTLSQLALHDEHSSKPSINQKSKKHGTSGSPGSSLQVNSSSTSLDDSRFGEPTAIGKAESTVLTMGSRSSTGDINNIPDLDRKSVV